MANYFKPSGAGVNPATARMINSTISAMNMSCATTAEEMNNSNLLPSQMETLAQEQKMKEELDAKLEQDILDNVDVNFIFNKGMGLS